MNIDSTHLSKSTITTFITEELKRLRSIDIYLAVNFFNANYPLFTYESNKELLQLFSLVKQRAQQNKMKYQGLDIELGNRFAISREDVITKIDGKMQERDKMISHQLLNTKNAVAIIGLNHMKGIQENLISEIGVEETRKRFLFIMPFSKFHIPELDGRVDILYCVNNNQFEKLASEYCPLKQLLAFDEMPIETANSRFRGIVDAPFQQTSIRAQQPQIKKTRCCPSLFSIFSRIFLNDAQTKDEELLKRKKTV